MQENNLNESNVPFALYAQKAKLTMIGSGELLSAGMAGVVQVRLSFSEDWQGLEKTAVFTNGTRTVRVAEEHWDEGLCTVPAEVLQTPGKTVMAGVYGAALALTRPEVAAALDGQVIFFATPAEEYGEVEFKKRLMREGKLRLGGGKCELIRIGAFDDVDVAVTHHSGLEGITLGGRSGNGFVSKVITIRGTAAHAAAHPEAGRNALSAASLGLQALALNRETFRDEDCVRVHPILTKGGDLVNVVPAEAVLETLVRAKTREAIEDANTKTDRSFRSGALAMDTGLTIETMPGYLPVLRQKTPEEILRAVQAALGTERVKPADLSNHDGGSTDVGDVQHLLPVLTFHTGGMAGNLHTSDFDIVDEEEAYLDTARIFAIHAYLLLKDHAALAKKLKTKYTPVFSDKEEYSAYVEAFRSELVFG